jgi:ribosome biogenesis GTPase / thiamine phosphate phosphatase
MSKRKLNRRQQWRVEKIQKERTDRSQKRERDIGTQLQSGDLSSEQVGLVISHFGQLLDVEALEGEDQGKIHRCYARANIDSLVTGDRVIWRAGKDYTGVIEARTERKSCLTRPDPYGDMKVVASNIDHIIMVFAAEPEPHQNLIDRYLVAAQIVQIEPILLLNKTDLLNDSNRPKIESLLTLYEGLGYRIIHASTTQQHGMDELLGVLQGNTSVFVGQSGVGKSSLINMLLPGENIRVQELSEQTRKGLHTTTTARLFHLPESGDLIDSPGVREFGLWHISETELEQGFREFKEFLGYCKFRDCRHLDEPGCAIKKAVDEGNISPRRLDSYFMIRKTMDEQETRYARE